MSMSPQNKILLNHLLTAGSITQREAIMDHSIQSLTRRITDLRDMGVSIDREDRKHPVTNQRYARYVLQQTPQSLAAARTRLKYA